jgi:hypothetical protein
MTDLEKMTLLKERGYVYDPVTGDIISPRGKVLKKTTPDGYKMIHLSMFSVLSHRYAWFYYYGEIAPDQIDHIDRNPSNNKIENLRSVTNTQNQYNRGAKGWYFCKRSQKYIATIRINSRNKYLGAYETADEANKRYLDEKPNYHKL